MSKEKTRSESQRKLWRVPLTSITTSNNTRNPLSPEMQKAGHIAFPQEPKYPLSEKAASALGVSSKDFVPGLWQLATSEDPEHRKTYVNLIDEHESGEGGIRELASSILINGLVNPVTLRENRGGESFSIVAGARRVLAAAYNWCRGAGQPYIEAAVNKDSGNENLYRGIAENSCRKNPNLMERARACQLAVNGGSTTTEIAEREGCSEQTIRNRLRLLELDAKHQKAVAAGKLTLTKALELLRNGAIVETDERGDPIAADDEGEHGGKAAPVLSGKHRKRVRKYGEIFERYNTLVSEINFDKMDATDRREKELLEWILRITENEP